MSGVIRRSRSMRTRTKSSLAVVIVPRPRSIKSRRLNVSQRLDSRKSRDKWLNVSNLKRSRPVMRVKPRTKQWKNLTTI